MQLPHLHACPPCCTGLLPPRPLPLLHFSHLFVPLDTHCTLSSSSGTAPLPNVNLHAAPPTNSYISALLVVTFEICSLTLLRVRVLWIPLPASSRLHCFSCSGVTTWLMSSNSLLTCDHSNTPAWQSPHSGIHLHTPSESIPGQWNPAGWQHRSMEKDALEKSWSLVLTGPSMLLVILLYFPKVFSLSLVLSNNYLKLHLLSSNLLSPSHNSVGIPPLWFFFHMRMWLYPLSPASQRKQAIAKEFSQILAIKITNFHTHLFLVFFLIRWKLGHVFLASCCISSSPSTFLCFGHFLWEGQLFSVPILTAAGVRCPALSSCSAWYQLLVSHWAHGNV